MASSVRHRSPRSFSSVSEQSKRVYRETVHAVALAGFLIVGAFAATGESTQADDSGTPDKQPVLERTKVYELAFTETPQTYLGTIIGEYVINCKNGPGGDLGSTSLSITGNDAEGTSLTGFVNDDKLDQPYNPASIIDCP